MLLRPGFFMALVLVLAPAGLCFCADAPATGPVEGLRVIDPPEKGFFSKRLDYEGIPIKAHRDVSDRAMAEARQRLSMMLGRVPSVRARLAAAGAELHIIGKDQVTSDLPEHRRLKGKPFDGKLTVDERTRGLGGLLTSCGEENLLRLKSDRYRGRDICVHEFAHNIYNQGMTDSVHLTFKERYGKALDEGLWAGSYAASNDDEFFAETNMWYFGTHGDLGMKGPKPGAGRDGLKAYDPRTFALLDEFYGGAMESPPATPRIEALTHESATPAKEFAPILARPRQDGGI